MIAAITPFRVSSGSLISCVNGSLSSTTFNSSSKIASIIDKSPVRKAIESSS